MTTLTPIGVELTDEQLQIAVGGRGCDEGRDRDDWDNDRGRRGRRGFSGREYRFNEHDSCEHDLDVDDVRFRVL